MLVWYPVSAPLLPDVDESDSRFAKLRISISAGKFSVDNGIHWYISSDTSDDLTVLRICAPTDVRVVHQQEKVCRTRPGSSKKWTVLRGKYWYHSLGVPQLRILVSAFGLSKMSCIRGTAARRCRICSSRDRRRTPQRLLARSQRRDLSRDSAPTTQAGQRGLHYFPSHTRARAHYLRRPAKPRRKDAHRTGP